MISEGGFRGEIVFIETREEDNFAHIKLNDEIELNVKIDSNYKLNSGDPVQLDFDVAKMYFFDSSGERIYPDGKN